MRLLIVTQKIDRSDGVLGFMHRWVEVLAVRFEKVTVICLYKGVYDFPKNVSVFSLGKEHSASHIKYILNFYKYIWKVRKEYDTVFVHMNREYVILGGLLWRLWHKKIIFWYNHRQGNILSRLAGFLSDRILYTSEYSFFAGGKKTLAMPVGVDMTCFKFSPLDDGKISILCFGRIAPVKNIDVFIDALLRLHNNNDKVSARIIGDCLPKDKWYYEKIQISAKPLLDSGLMSFQAGVSNEKAPKVFSESLALVNATASGSFDKTIIEGMATGRLVISCNQSFSDLIPEPLRDFLIFSEGDPQDLALKISTIISLPLKDKDRIARKLREIVEREHSLSVLVSALYNLCETLNS